jgi:hypothetical protein
LCRPLDPLNFNLKFCYLQSELFFYWIRVKLRKQSIFVFWLNWVHPIFTLISLSASTRCYIYFHCSYMHCYYNYSRTLCIKCWVSAISCPYLIEISLLCGYHSFEVERGVWKSKEAQRQGQYRMTLQISLISNAWEYFIIIIFNFTPLMVKLKVSMLCFNHFMDIFNLVFILHFGVIDNCNKCVSHDDELTKLWPFTHQCEHPSSSN